MILRFSLSNEHLHDLSFLFYVYVQCHDIFSGNKIFTSQKLSSVLSGITSKSVLPARNLHSREQKTTPGHQHQSYTIDLTTPYDTEPEYSCIGRQKRNLLPRSVSFPRRYPLTIACIQAAQPVCRVREAPIFKFVKAYCRVGDLY